MSEALRTEYERAVRGLWEALYETENTDDVPKEVQNPIGFRLERARRLAAVSCVLSARLPTASFLYLAAEGTEGIARFLVSRAWREREREPGEPFPPPASSARSFATYLTEEGWCGGRPDWQGELAHAELDLNYGELTPSAEATGIGVRPAVGTRLRVSPYDTVDYARRVALKKAQMPWEQVLGTARPVARVTAQLVPGGGTGAGRTLILRDAEASALARLVDQAWVPTTEPSDALLDRLVKVGAFTREAAG
ncbi:hypothetical protein ACIBCO_14215 [Streptomyces violascens]|uniref:hypothetical protein n=1 Tax=Streptomyces violascens TaxID=67381 RepID=UPI0037921542